MQVEFFQFLPNLQTILHWHLEIKQQQTYWSANCLVIVLNLLKCASYNFLALVDSLLPVYTKLALILKFKTGQILSKNLEVD